jgi:hypothetical protein
MKLSKITFLLIIAYFSRFIMGSGIAQRTAGAAPANNKRRDSDSRPKSGKLHMPTESLDELGSLYTALGKIFIRKIRFCILEKIQF